MASVDFFDALRSFDYGAVQKSVTLPIFDKVPSHAGHCTLNNIVYKYKRGIRKNERSAA